jgi:hypothetical protein
MSPTAGLPTGTVVFSYELRVTKEQGGGVGFESSDHSAIDAFQAAVNGPMSAEIRPDQYGFVYLDGKIAQDGIKALIGPKPEQKG